MPCGDAVRVNDYAYGDGALSIYSSERVVRIYYGNQVTQPQVFQPILFNHFFVEQLDVVVS